MVVLYSAMVNHCLQKIQFLCIKSFVKGKILSLILVVIPFISTLKYIHRSPTYNGADDALMLSAAISSSSAADVS